MAGPVEERRNEEEAEKMPEGLKGNGERVEGGGGGSNNIILGGEGETDE